MIQRLFETVKKTNGGVVTGGSVQTLGLTIAWQDGPLVDPVTELPIASNGVFLQTVLQACINRLAAFQESPMRSRENAVALTHLETAQLWLGKRETERAARGVLGTHIP